MKTWAFIPARGGSRSITKKNMKLLGGIPLVNWVISAACAAKSVDAIYVSSDDPDILQEAWEHGGVETCTRPPHLTDGKSYPIIDVINDFLSNFLKSNHPDAILLLQPTSPFVRSELINEATHVLQESPSINSVQTVCTVGHNSHAYNQRTTTDGGVTFVYPTQRRACYNKQLKPTFFTFGNLVLTRTDSILAGDIFAHISYPLYISPYEAQDLDSEWEFKVAEALLNAQSKKESTEKSTA